MSRARQASAPSAEGNKRMITIPVGGRPPKHGQPMQRQLVIRMPAALLERLEGYAGAKEQGLAEAVGELLDGRLNQEGF